MKIGDTIIIPSPSTVSGLVTGRVVSFDDATVCAMVQMEDVGFGMMFEPRWVQRVDVILDDAIDRLSGTLQTDSCGK